MITEPSPGHTSLDPSKGAQPAGAAAVGPDDGLRQAAVAPLDVDLETAAGLQTPDTAIRPRRRQRRQQEEEAVVTLKEHLGDARRAAEVAVRRSASAALPGYCISQRVSPLVITVCHLPILYDPTATTSIIYQYIAVTDRDIRGQCIVR